MKVLVTGGAGFIGSHLSAALVARGDQVIVVDNLSTGTRSFVPPEARFLDADILLPDTWKNDVGTVDAVIHLAAQISVPFSETYPMEDLRTNLQGTLAMLETASFLGAREFRLASSAAVYGDVSALPLRELGPSHPISFYGLNKWAAEQYLLHWATTHEMIGIALRLANVYGPRQRTAGEGGVVAMFCEALASGTTLTVHGDGSQTRDFIAVQDVALAFAHRLGNPGPSAVYNVSTGTTTSVLDLIEVLGAVSGQNVRYLTAEPRIGDIHDSLLSTALAEQWEFRAQTPLAQGLEETWHYFQQTGR
jgi:UDP-glucose 4-epimerase